VSRTAGPHHFKGAALKVRLTVRLAFLDAASATRSTALGIANSTSKAACVTSFSTRLDTQGARVTRTRCMTVGAPLALSEIRSQTPRSAALERSNDVRPDETSTSPKRLALRISRRAPFGRNCFVVVRRKPVECGMGLRQGNPCATEGENCSWVADPQLRKPVHHDMHEGDMGETLPELSA
jgi:hypothetical protein